ncbi:hypothetical protein LUZ61_016217 [Rhynchospora tenuis]|uniref:Cupin type-1 domain-containing protein n=1 Tax=Rhynchospora tenuis TaxID=198213 RepID=A0AAD5Z544_9POAL|nr:hypothetical protein LUZ61_016217 [Rhynchospora tenuis]
MTASSLLSISLCLLILCQGSLAQESVCRVVILEPRGLLLPYNNAPSLMYIVQGRGFIGTVFPGCPETFQPFQQQSEKEQFPMGSESWRQQRTRDEHQRVHRFKQGDIIALPAGVTYWCYNEGDVAMVSVQVYDASNTANQLVPWERGLQMLMTTRGQEMQQQEFEEAMQGWQQYSQSTGAQYNITNGLDEMFCTIKIRSNIDRPSHADYFNQRGSRRVQVVNHRGQAVFDGQLRQGQILLITQNFAVLKKASEREMFHWVSFVTNSNHLGSQIAGKSSVFQGMPFQVLMHSYRLSLEQARVLKFGRQDETIVFSPRILPLALPGAVFRCESLEEFVLDVPYPGIEPMPALRPRLISLSLLRRLDIHAEARLDDAFIGKLMFGCPMLEELSLTRCKLEFFMISSDVLKHLHIGACDHHEKLCIHTPNLLSLELYGALLGGYTFTNITSLVKAVIDFGGFLDEHDYLWGDPFNNADVLQALSNVMHLELHGEEVKAFLQKEIFNLPNFENLRSLYCWTDDTFYPIAGFLLGTFNLEKLTLFYTLQLLIQLSVYLSEARQKTNFRTNTYFIIMELEEMQIN